MPGGKEKKRRSQNRDETYSSVASASSLFFINTTNYYRAGNQVIVTDAVQKGEREGKGKITSADYCSLCLVYLVVVFSLLNSTNYCCE